MKEMFDSSFAFIGWLAGLWAFISLLIMYRRLSKKTERGASAWGAILMEFLLIVAAPVLVMLLLWAWFSWTIPKVESSAPELAAKSRTGTNILGALEDPCSIPGAGNWLCGDNPARFGEQGQLTQGEQAGTAAGAPIVAIPTGPQPVLVEGEDALRACYQAWYASFSVDGAAKIAAGLPPDGKSNVTDWIPSTAGSATLVVRTPAGINNNNATLTHWLLPAPIKLAQDELKLWHSDDEGTWSVSGTGSWPEACYAMPTPAPLPTTAAPVSPPSVSPPEGLTLTNDAGVGLFVPGGTDLFWCFVTSQAAYACSPNEAFAWRP